MKPPIEDKDFEGLRDIWIECPAGSGAFGLKIKICLAFEKRWWLKPQMETVIRRQYV